MLVAVHNVATGGVKLAEALNVFIKYVYMYTGFTHDSVNSVLLLMDVVKEWLFLSPHRKPRQWKAPGVINKLFLNMSSNAPPSPFSEYVQNIGEHMNYQHMTYVIR